MIYLQLFWSFIKVGLLGFGGGMAIISLIQNEVLSHGWMTETEFIDIVAVSQVTPGPIGMNCATYAGYTATGNILGSLIASVAIILPSLVIMLSVCAAYNRISNRWSDSKWFKTAMRIIRIAVVVLIAHAAYTLVTPATFIDYRSRIIFAVSLALMLLPDVFGIARRPDLAKSRPASILSHPVLIMIAAGMAGYFIYM